jgi:hypothetical protein
VKGERMTHPEKLNLEEATLFLCFAAYCQKPICCKFGIRTFHCDEDCRFRGLPSCLMDLYRESQRTGEKLPFKVNKERVCSKHRRPGMFGHRPNKKSMETKK